MPFLMLFAKGKARSERLSYRECADQPDDGSISAYFIDVPEAVRKEFIGYGKETMLYTHLPGQGYEIVDLTDTGPFRLVPAVVPL